MTKRELIDEILAARCTAQPEFLAQFGDNDLQEYLDHLRQARQPRLSGDARRYEKYFRGFVPSSPAAAPLRRPAGSSTWRSAQPILTPVVRQEVCLGADQPDSTIEGTYITNSQPARQEADYPGREVMVTAAVPAFEQEARADEAWSLDGPEAADGEHDAFDAVESMPEMESVATGADPAGDDQTGTDDPNVSTDPQTQSPPSPEPFAQQQSPDQPAWLF